MLHDLRTVEGLRRGATRELIQLIERATLLGTGTAAKQAHAEPERIGGPLNGAYVVLSGDDSFWKITAERCCPAARGRPRARPLRGLA